MSRQSAFLKTKKSEPDYGEKPPLRGVFLLPARTPGIFELPTLKHILFSFSALVAGPSPVPGHRRRFPGQGEALLPAEG